MVTCAKCGVENPDGANACRMCGNTLGTGMRHCVSCGRSIDWDVNVCPYCGHDFRMIPQSAAKTISTGMTVLLIIVSVLIPIAGIIIGIVFMLKDDPEEKRVGKICLIIGVVVMLLSVGLSVLLYVVVLGFGTSGDNMTPTTTLSKTAVIDGFRFNFGPVNPYVAWSDVMIVLTDAQNSVSWSPNSEDLSGDVVVTHEYATRILSSVVVTFSVTDLTGDGSLDMGDYMTLTSPLGFSATTDYGFTVIYEPTDGSMCSITFSG